MRTLTDHKLNGCNEHLKIQVIDAPGSGGANHRYAIRPARALTETDPIGSSQRARAACDINFQNGPINEHGVNGITQEALLAVCIDRLRSFQAGPFACRENAVALTKMEEALMWLQKRTNDRLKRGVEGTSEK
jgi:hypothetical protein